MEPLILVATFEATPSTRPELAERLTEMVRLSEPEPGCVRYELHVERGNENRFVFLETWADRESWDRHMETAHVLALLADVPQLTIHGVQLQQLRPV